MNKERDDKMKELLEKSGKEFIFWFSLMYSKKQNEYIKEKVLLKNGVLKV